MKIRLLLLALITASFAASAEYYAIEARIDGMGGAGSAIASHTSAGFFNPALVNFYTDQNIGVLFPSLGIEFRDKNDTLKKMEDFPNLYRIYVNNPSDPAISQLTASTLAQLQHQRARMKGGISAAAVISSAKLSVSLFLNGYTKGLVLPQINQEDIANIYADNPANLSSTAQVLAFGLVDFGVVIGSKFELFNQNIAVGITPKTQKIYVYDYLSNIDAFNFDNWDDIENRNQTDKFNLDIGLAWDKPPFRVGLVAKNIFAENINTLSIGNIVNYQYEFKPSFTLGVAYISTLLTLAIDIDLNKQDGFSALNGLPINDDQKLIRMGAEMDMFKFAKLRFGYVHDIENTLNGTLTFGLGLPLFDEVNLELAAQIIDKHSYGGAVQLSFAF